MAFKGKGKYASTTNNTSISEKRSPKKRGKSGWIVVLALFAIVGGIFSGGDKSDINPVADSSNSAIISQNSDNRTTVGGNFKDVGSKIEDVNSQISEETSTISKEETEILKEAKENVNEVSQSPSPSPELTPVPTPEPVRYPIVYIENGTKFVKTNSAPIYSGAYDTFSVIGYYSYATEVSYSERDIDKDGDDWFKISYNGTEGYISHYYVQDTKPQPTPTPTPQQPQRQARTNSDVGHYVLNTSNHKFHYAWCSRGPTKNRAEGDYSRNALISQGYVPCKVCNP